MVGQKGTVISGNFTSSLLVLKGKIRLESSVDQGKYLNIWDSRVSFTNDDLPYGVSITDGRVFTQTQIRIDGGSVSANGYEIYAALSGEVLFIGNRALVRFSNTSVDVSMGSLMVEEGAELTLTNGSYMYTRGSSWIRNASVSVVDSRMVHMKSFSVGSKSNLLVRRSDLLMEMWGMTVQDSFLSVEDSSLKCTETLNLLSTTTTFRNASVELGSDSDISLDVVGGNVSYVDTLIFMPFGILRLFSLDSDSQVSFANTTARPMAGSMYGVGLIVKGEPSIYVDKSSQIHCSSGQFASRSGRNGSITVEGSVMNFSSCDSPEQSSVAGQLFVI